MGLDGAKIQENAKSPADYEKSKILALVEIIKNSDLVASVDIVWAHELEHMAQTMPTKPALKSVGVK